MRWIGVCSKPPDGYHGRRHVSGRSGPIHRICVPILSRQATRPARDAAGQGAGSLEGERCLDSRHAGSPHHGDHGTPESVRRPQPAGRVRVVARSGDRGCGGCCPLEKDLAQARRLVGYGLSLVAGFLLSVSFSAGRHGTAGCNCPCSSWGLRSWQQCSAVWAIGGCCHQ